MTRLWHGFVEWLCVLVFALLIASVLTVLAHLVLPTLPDPVP